MRNGLSQDEFEIFRVFLEEACGIVLGENKHYLIVSRLSRIMEKESIGSITDLVNKLKHPRGGKLKEKIVDAMTTNETFWFRDKVPFEILKQDIFPEMADRRVSSMRIWSAACSSGQEPNSISITASEFLSKRPGSISDIQITATDISPTILQEAQESIYDDAALGRGMSEERRDRFFVRVGNRWQVRPEIRKRIRYTQANLLNNYALLGRFDVIFCRNVLIYFSSESKREILSRMARALNSGGYLFLGSSEAINRYSDEFKMIRCKAGTAYQVIEDLDRQPKAFVSSK